MKWLNHLLLRRKLYSELSAEIREHLEEKIEELTAQGMSREQATHVARREFGNITLTEETSRDVWRWSSVEDLFLDARYALRVLRKNPGFTTVAVVTLALGIAANTTIFSAVNGWMLRRPRIKDPARVVVVVTTDPSREEWGWDRQPVSAFDFMAWREQNRSFETMVASEPEEFTLSGEGEPERVLGLRVSADYFQVLGADAVLGRTFLADEGQSGRNRVIILSNGFWQRRLGSNSKVIGHVVRLNRENYTVIGVMSSHYRIGVYSGPELWTPLVFQPEDLLPAARGNRSLEVMARLKSGASIETARAEMVALAQRSEQAHPGTSKGWSASAMSIQHFIADEFGVGMRLQMGITLFVLLIACVNVASLQLARGAERQTEFAVRMALGAGRFRLVRQSLVESLLIALAGGGLGLLLASCGVHLLRRGLSSIADVSAIAREVTIDQSVMLFTLGISAFAAVLFGLVPAVRQSTIGLHLTLKEGSRAISQSKGRHRTQSVLVTAQIALALVLVIAEGVLVQEFLDRVHAGFGINSNQVLTANISLSNAGHKDPSKQAAFFQEAIQRVEALPGVISAGATSTLPLGDYERTVTFSIEGRPALSRSERGRTTYFAISPGYLRTLEIPLIRGRSFLSSDSAQALPVALVNEAFVRRYFPDEDSIGKRLRLDTDSLDRPNWSEIVGVVGDVRGSFDQRKYVPQVYESYPQNSSSVMTLVLRTGSNPAAFAPMLRRAVWSLDKDQPITAVQTMNEVMVQSGAGMWVTNILIGTFAGLGLALAAVGVFAVMAYAVAQRTHEIGIRMALGARRTDVLRMLVKKGMVLGAVGIGSGLALAAPLVWFKLGLVNDDFMPFDQRSPVFLAAALLIWLTALLASYVPALRAMRVDPTVALRHE